MELDLPMPVRRVAGNSKVAATRGQVALERGPVACPVSSTIVRESMRLVLHISSISGIVDFKQKLPCVARQGPAIVNLPRERAEGCFDVWGEIATLDPAQRQVNWGNPLCCERGPVSKPGRVSLLGAERVPPAGSGEGQRSERRTRVCMMLRSP